jgi:lipoprotein signal peptidase
VEIELIPPMIRTHFVYNTGLGAFTLEKIAKVDKLETISPLISLVITFCRIASSKSNYLTVNLN